MLVCEVAYSPEESGVHCLNASANVRPQEI